jgi:hypothetical protein
MTAVAALSMRTATLQLYADAMAGGTLSFYAGTRPAITDTSHTPQAVCGLASPAATVSGATLTLGAVSDGLRTDSQVITWARFATAAGDAILDVDVTATGAGGDVQLSNTAGPIGAFVIITSGTFNG